MPTRKVSERERLTMYARQATDAELDTAFEILSIERRVRAAGKSKPVNGTGTAKKSASKKPASAPGVAGGASDAEKAGETN